MNRSELIRLHPWAKEEELDNLSDLLETYPFARGQGREQIEVLAAMVSSPRVFKHMGNGYFDLVKDPKCPVCEEGFDVNDAVDLMQLDVLEKDGEQAYVHEACRAQF